MSRDEEPGTARAPTAGRVLLESTALLLLLAVAALPRVAELDRSLMSDELRWTCRSIAFRQPACRSRFPASTRLNSQAQLIQFFRWVPVAQDSF